MSAIQLTSKTINGQSVAYLTFDLPNEKVNKLSTPVMLELRTHLENLKSSNHKMIVFQSAKPKIFIAGADIEEIKNLKTKEDVQNAVKNGQSIFNLIEDMPMPTMALINGACAGGGCDEYFWLCRLKYNHFVVG